MKSIAKTALCGLMIGVLSVSATFAAPGEGQGKQDKQRLTAAERFAKMDADGSGGVSLAEFTTAHQERVAKMKERLGDRERPQGARTPREPSEIFDRMDENGDGVLTADELPDRAPRRGAKGGKRGKKGPPADE